MTRQHYCVVTHTLTQPSTHPRTTVVDMALSHAAVYKSGDSPHVLTVLSTA